MSSKQPLWDPNRDGTSVLLLHQKLIGKNLLVSSFYLGAKHQVLYYLIIPTIKVFLFLLSLFCLCDRSFSSSCIFVSYYFWRCHCLRVYSLSVLITFSCFVDVILNCFLLHPSFWGYFFLCPVDVFSELMFFSKACFSVKTFVLYVFVKHSILR